MREGRDGDTLHAKISMYDKTRVSIANGFLKNIIATDGDLVIEPDKDTGQVFIQPRRGETRTISTFMIDGKGTTFTVLLTPVDMPSDAILIKNLDAVSASAIQHAKSSDYERGLKNFALTMMRKSTDVAGIDIEPVMQFVPLWNEVLFVKKMTYRSPSYLGERYSLTNKTSSEMVLTEQEFFRDDVLGVVVEKHTLAPGESTDVLTIRYADRD